MALGALLHEGPLPWVFQLLVKSPSPLNGGDMFSKTSGLANNVLSFSASPPKMATPKIISIPIKLDAFVFNAAVCGGTSTEPNEDENKDKAKIAPFSQPNYSFLRFNRSMVQNDILTPTDLHKTGPAIFNSRYADLGTEQPWLNRQGIYLHWIVPRPYRTGSAISQRRDDENKDRLRKGFAPKHPPSNNGAPPSVLDHPDDQGEINAPDFLPAPPRWLIIRRVNNSIPQNVLSEVDAWVVESDRRHELADIPADADIRNDYSPFVLGFDNPNALNDAELNQQAEVFIGYKENISSWTESVGNPSVKPENQPLRVELNLLNSSNQLFPDYQLHNGNTFSIVDTLQYSIDNKNNFKAVDKADVSYYVIGWHSKSSRDPFSDFPPGSTTRGDRLRALNMILNGDNPVTQAGISAWLASSDPTAVILHGAMYNVIWNKDSKPTNMPADSAYEKLNKDQPVSIGTTPLDALMTYISSHTDPIDDTGDVKKIEQDLLRIQKFLYAQDSGVNAQDEAEDMIYNWNYSITSGGGQWFLSASDGEDTKNRPTAPDPEVIKNLDLLNCQQRLFDSLARQLRFLRSDMFFAWWQYISNKNIPSIDIKGKTNVMEKLIAKMKETATAAEKQKELIPGDLAQMGATPGFYQAHDPTMLVAGIEAGWAYDFLDPLKTRVDTQFYDNSTSSMDDEWSKFCDIVIPKLPIAIQQAARSLIGEFVDLNPSIEVPAPPSAGYEIPLYHDLDKIHPLTDGSAPWRDRWEDSQAWFPLFLEWEAEYTHIPYEDEIWELEPKNAWPSQPTKLRYGIKDGVDLADQKINDRRTVSGRVLILPQASFSLQNAVMQVLATLPDDILTPEEKEELKQNLHELAFLSSPLSGFTGHLITQVHGTHLKPNLRIPNPKPPIPELFPFRAAVENSSEFGFDTLQFLLMGVETDITPYGSLVPYFDESNCPFKPASHGQFRFTVLNIIDKFGQAITAIDPTPRKDDEGMPPLYPCISDYYSPQPLSTNKEIPNTVVRNADDPEGSCQYAQLSPSVNQPARLNTAFVDYFPEDPLTSTRAGWRPITEWDNPVWGWVVPNYANSSIQLFLADGNFFREIRLGGTAGTTSAGSWLPFQRPPMIDSDDPNVHQLELFANELAKKEYLHSFMSMLELSLATVAPPPNAYSEFLSSLIGKPLALVRWAVSLELSTDQYTDTSSLSKIAPPMTLLPEETGEQYNFGIQLGDASRVYDGLIGYLRPVAQPTPGNTLQLDKFYTHFVPKDGKLTPALEKISSNNYPRLSPFWINPVPTNSGDPSLNFAYEWNQKLQPFGALVDPFVAFHAYSGILPTKALKLPTWTWQEALSKMTAFFHIGPLISTTNTPSFEEKFKLPDDYDLVESKDLFPGPGMPMPGIRPGKWAWLQPYSMPVPIIAEGDDSASKQEYMAMGTITVDTRPRFEPAPYTAVEGYMQLRQAIGQDSPSGTT